MLKPELKWETHLYLLFLADNIFMVDKYICQGSVVVITPEIKLGDLEFDSQPRPWIFHLLQWVSISVPEDL